MTSGWIGLSFQAQIESALLQAWSQRTTAGERQKHFKAATLPYQPSQQAKDLLSSAGSPGMTVGGSQGTSL